MITANFWRCFADERLNEIMLASGYYNQELDKLKGRKSSMA